jgi:hypothetical protein
LPAGCAITLEHAPRLVQQAINISRKIAQSGDRPLALAVIHTLSLSDALTHLRKGIQRRLHACERHLGIGMRDMQLGYIRRRDDMLAADFTALQADIFDADTYDGPPLPQRIFIPNLLHKGIRERGYEFHTS